MKILLVKKKRREKNSRDAVKHDTVASLWRKATTNWELWLFWPAAAGIH